MIGVVTAVLVLLAALMAAITAYLVKWAAATRTRGQAAVVLFLLAMMATMFAGALVYFTAPSGRTAVEGLWVASAAMSASVFPVFWVFLEEARSRQLRGDAYVPTPIIRHRAFVAAVVALVLANELLMGWTFQLASGTAVAGAGSGPVGWLSGVASTLVSPWFVFTMGAEMALAVALLATRLAAPLRWILGMQAAVMILTPPALPVAGWSELAIVLGSAVMIAVIIFQMEYIYRHRQLPAALARYFLRLLAVYALMMVGLFAWLVYGSLPLLALSVALEMLLYLGALLDAEPFGAAPGPPWQLQPGWTFQLLAAIFVGELFMGAVLDLTLLPNVYGGGFPSLPLAGGPGTLLYDAFYNGFWFLAAVTGSTWFLAMMGIEMGVLVVFRLRESISRENKARLVLVLGSYAAFATFFPSYYYSALFPNAPAGTAVPVLGWSMGLGSAPVAPSIFAVILLTYVITGTLVALFGRRVICGVFCTPALMYGGTTFNAMSSFNRSSPVARKYLSSRFSTVYSVTTGVTMAGLVAVSSLSYLDQTGALAISFLGADPSVFFLALSFGVLWFLIFVTIPYTGNYNCVTMGWCYTGTIAAAFSRIGFFKLKVRDRTVCQRCTTLDCAKKCPVGLVDMPGHFRNYGEFRSSKCCGIGNCVDACPYGNLYIHDVRHVVAARWPFRGGRRGPTPLPMLRPTVSGPSGVGGSAPIAATASVRPSGTSP